jgi:hypothetical protein
VDTLILVAALVLHTVVVLRIGFRQGVDVERARTVLADPLSPLWRPQGQESLLQGLTTAEYCGTTIIAPGKCGSPVHTSLGDAPCLKPINHQEPCQ